MVKREPPWLVRKASGSRYLIRLLRSSTCQHIFYSDYLLLSLTALRMRRFRVKAKQRATLDTKRNEDDSTTDATTEEFDCYLDGCTFSTYETLSSLPNEEQKTFAA